MKRLFLVSAVTDLALLMSCSPKEDSQDCDCSQYTSVKQSTLGKSSLSKDSGTVINGNYSLTEDTTIEGDVTMNGGLNLNGFTLTITGHLHVNGNLNGGGILWVDSYEVTGVIQNNPIINYNSTLSVGNIEYDPCKSWCLNR